MHEANVRHSLVSKHALPVPTGALLLLHFAVSANEGDPPADQIHSAGATSEHVDSVVQHFSMREAVVCSEEHDPLARGTHKSTVPGVVNAVIRLARYLDDRQSAVRRASVLDQDFRKIDRSVRE